MFRLCVSSVLKYDFAWNLEGIHQVVASGVRYHFRKLNRLHWSARVLALVAGGAGQQFVAGQLFLESFDLRRDRLGDDHRIVGLTGCDRRPDA